MTTLKTLTTTFAVLGVLVVSSATAQLKARIEVDPESMGTSYQIVLTNSLNTDVSFLDSCIVNEARLSNQDGPTVWSAQACSDVLIILQGKGNLSHSWTAVDNAGDALPAGTYFLRISYAASGFKGLHHQWLELDHAPRNPVLTRLGDARVGESTFMRLSAPQYGGSLYAMAASGSVLSGEEGLTGLMLIPDALFDLSLQSPFSGLFQNFQGPIDADGMAAGIAVHLPVIPSLAGQSFHVQALVGFDPFAAIEARFSNVLSFTIFPELE